MNFKFFQCCYGLLKKKTRIIDECPICFEDRELVRLERCNHLFCDECIDEWITKSGVVKECPLCRSELKYTIFPYYKSFN